MEHAIMSVSRMSIAALFSSLCAACASGGGASTSANAPQAAIAPTAPVFVLSDVMGKSAEALDAQFGAPALTRREGEGEFRRYDLKECGLIVILFPEPENTPKAVHVDATAKSSAEAKPVVDACLAAGLGDDARNSASRAGV